MAFRLLKTILLAFGCGVVSAVLVFLLGGLLFYLRVQRAKAAQPGMGAVAGGLSSSLILSVMAMAIAICLFLTLRKH
jgi:hypothetical protein